jgi:hypothetical protein
MQMSLLLAVLGLTTVGVGVANYILRHRLGQKAETLVESLWAAAEPSAPSTFETSPHADLPAPIRRYLAHVLRDERPYVQAVRIEQHGTFRSEGTASPWSAFTATQHVTTRPPGFVWDATIDLFPWIPVRVVDAYREGEGLLCAKLGGILTVAHPEPGPDLDEGELMRYLAEAPLYPTALLPGMGVAWTPIDDQSARATLTHRGTTASLVFHVNDRDEVERVTGKRPFLKNDGTSERRPWKGTWHNYEEHHGLCVPTDGEVAWIHPHGEVSYWRGHIDSLDYRTGVVM